MNKIFRISQIFIAIIFKAASRLLFRLEISGHENVKNLSGSLIIAANHQSYVDHFFFLAALPLTSKLFPIRTLAYAGLYKNPFLNIGLHILGALPVRQGEGLQNSLAQAAEILRQGGVVAIYPQGRREQNISLEPKIGAGALALQTKTPVLPAAIRGLEHLTVLKFFFGGLRVGVAFGQPIFLHEVVKLSGDESYDIFKMSAAEATKIIYDAIKNLYAQ